LCAHGICFYILKIFREAALSQPNSSQPSYSALFNSFANPILDREAAQAEEIETAMR
jgi:hypothetical protein